MSDSQKNYEAALSSLQSAFGFGGTAPCLPPPSSAAGGQKVTASGRGTGVPSATPNQPQTTSLSKDDQSAFGSPESMNGLGREPTAGKKN